MLRCAGLYVSEVDDPGLALSQALAQLSEKIELLANTVGVVMCNPEFVESGALRHVAENLPFDVAGVTTSALAVNGSGGEVALSIFVMTSDTIRFKAGIFELNEADVEGSLRAAIEETGEGPDAPGLVLAFPPLGACSGDEFTEAWGKVFPSTPVFGGLSSDESADFANVKSICRGAISALGHSFILCYGDIRPRFVIATLPEGNILPHAGEITKSKSNIVYEINGVNAYEFLKNIGFANDLAPLGAFWFLPFLVSQRKREDYDGVPVVRGMAAFGDDGSASFRGKMDQGSAFTLMNMTAEDVLEETAAKLRSALEMPEVNGILIFSCVVRHMVLMHRNPLEEMELAEEILGSTPFMMGYVAGECCPTSEKNGAHVNRFHNYSLVALVL